MLQLIRKDLIDDEPVILFQKPITLSNLEINSAIYYNFKIIINLTTFCDITNKISINETESKECIYYNQNNNLICEFKTKMKVEKLYYLYFDNKYLIKSISTLEGFSYTISSTTAKNGKARFYINTLNDKFGVMNITNVAFSEVDKKDNKVEFNGGQIVYEKDNVPYVDIGEISLSDNIYI